MDNLNDLINSIDEIKDEFSISGGSGMPEFNSIYRSTKFLNWKKEIQFELQKIYDNSGNEFIRDTLVLVKEGFNGWQDEQKYNELSGYLRAIQKNIVHIGLEDTKKMKLFISHKSEDKELINGFVDLLISIGFSSDNLIYTSKPGYGIPLGMPIYEYLKKTLNNDVVIIYMLSNNYYKSPACLNEMGGAWVNSSKGYVFMLPLFTYQEIDGAIDPRAIASKLDDSLKLTELKNELVDQFKISRPSDIVWEDNKSKYLAEYEVEKKKYKERFNYANIEFYGLDYEKNRLLYRLTNNSNNKIKFRELKIVFDTTSGENEIEITNDNIIYPNESRIEFHQLDEDTVGKILYYSEVKLTYKHIVLS